MTQIHKNIPINVRIQTVEETTSDQKKMLPPATHTHTQTLFPFAADYFGVCIPNSNFSHF